MPVSAEPVGGPRPVMDAVVLTVGGVPVTRGEIRRWAERFDPRFGPRVARRAALSVIATDDETLDAQVDAEVEELAAEFRYARSLESAESLLRWTELQGISVDDWWESLRISVLERRAVDGEAAGPSDSEASERDETTSDADLVVTDLLAYATEALARRSAVARALDRLPAAWAGDGTASPDANDARHDTLETTWDSWKQAILDESALQRVVEHERLAWMVFDLLETHWATAGAGREAVACVRVDGLSLEEVAREAGVAIVERSCLLGDLDGALRDALVAAAAGELVGPVEQAPQWVVCVVRAKRLPTLAEPLVRLAAEQALESRGASPLVAEHVRRVAPV